MPSDLGEALYQPVLVRSLIPSTVELGYYLDGTLFCQPLKSPRFNNNKLSVTGCWLNAELVNGQCSRLGAIINK